MRGVEFLSRLRGAAAAGLAVAAAGCATGPAPGPDAGAAAGIPLSGDCAALASAWDAATSSHGAADAQAARIDGQPFLRVDRYLASVPARAHGGSGTRGWVEDLAALDARARAAELANLPAEAREGLGADPLSAAARCRRGAIEDVVASAGAMTALVAAAGVAPSYEPGARLVGIYPVTSALFLGGVERLHEAFASVYATPLEALPVAGRLERYAPALPPADPADATLAVPGGSRAPDVADPAIAALLDLHAPVYEIDVATDDDRPGAPRWTDGLPDVDVERPAVYRFASRAWLDGEPLLQLGYVVWFPARPPASATDLLAGRLDGLTWRVTLDARGEPVLYDAMHNCGCYHMFFPGEALERAPDARRYEEPILVPQAAPAGSGRVVLRIDHRTHHIVRVYRDASGAADRAYAVEDYDALRSLPVAGGGRRSLFGPDGLVAGTERGERFFFWPMGVRSAGAMRQRGHHATAFVGERHFDDPDLVERYFRRVP